MEAYPLEALLSVRHYREEGAKRAVRRAETAVREADALVETKMAELEEYRLWRKQEEDRRFDAIMEKPMSIGQIEDFKAGLALLADRETRKEEDVAKARKEAEKARQTLEKARADAKTAQKNAAKIAAHKDIWSVEAKKEAERLEDLELEEFRPISRKGAEAEGEDS